MLAKKLLSFYMRLYFTPNTYQQVATIFKHLRWKLLTSSAVSFSFYLILNNQINALTPDYWLWINLFVLFFALQMLILSAFIFFFRCLPSTQAKEPFWILFYTIIEWCEAIIFTFLLPLPALIFAYVLIFLL